METVYGLYVEGATTGEIPDFLRAEGAVHGPDPDDICYWYVPSAARARVRVWLEERSIDARYVYEFRATPDDRVDDLAAHLGIDYLGVDRLRRWVGADADPLIAKDRDDFRILATVCPRRRFPVFSERLVQVAKRAGVDLVIHLPYEGYEIEPW